MSELQPKQTSEDFNNDNFDYTATPEGYVDVDRIFDTHEAEIGQHVQEIASLATSGENMGAGNGRHRKEYDARADAQVVSESGLTEKAYNTPKHKLDVYGGARMEAEGLENEQSLGSRPAKRAKGKNRAGISKSVHEAVQEAAEKATAKKSEEDVNTARAKVDEAHASPSSEPVAKSRKKRMGDEVYERQRDRSRVGEAEKIASDPTDYLGAITTSADALGQTGLVVGAEPIRPKGRHARPGSIGAVSVGNKLTGGRHAAPEATPPTPAILGEGGVTSEEAPVQTELHEDTAGQQFATPRTTEAPIPVPVPSAEELASRKLDDEWGTFVEPSAQSDNSGMSPEEARKSAERRMGEPERKHGQTHSNDTVEYLKAAGEPQMGIPYVKPGEEAVPAPEAEQTTPDYEAEVLATAGERDTRTPEQVAAADEEADDSYWADLPEGADGEEKSVWDFPPYDPATAAHESSISDGDETVKMPAAKQAEAGDVSASDDGEDWYAGYGDDDLFGAPAATPEAAAVTATPEAGESSAAASTAGEPAITEGPFFDDGRDEASPLDALSREPLPDPFVGTHHGEASGDTEEGDDEENEPSLADELLGDGEDDEEKVTWRQRARNGWNRARAYLVGRDIDADVPDRDRRIAGRQLKAVAGAVGATVLAGALFGGLAGDHSNEGPQHVGKGTSASAEAKPGAVNSGKSDAKPGADTHRGEHGQGAGDLSHTFDVGRETVKISADNEVEVTLKQGGTVWDALDRVGDELHIQHTDEDIAETIQSMHLKPGQDRQMPVGSHYTFKVQNGKLVAK